MNDKITQIISALNENGINAICGYRHNNAVRPVKQGSVYVYPEKLEGGKLYYVIDVYSPFVGDLTGCMRLAQDTASVLSSKAIADELVISRVSYDNNSMGYVSRITANTVCENSGRVRVKFFGFIGKEELIINADVFDLRFETDYSSYPIYTIFNSIPVNVVYNSMKYKITIRGAQGGLGSLLSKYGIFNMSIVGADEDFNLYKCYVTKSDEPYGNTLTIEGYLKAE